MIGSIEDDILVIWLVSETMFEKYFILIGNLWKGEKSNSVDYFHYTFD